MKAAAWGVAGVAAVGLAGLAGLAAFTGLTARRIERGLPPRGRFIEIDGARLHYVDKGPANGGSGPAIVMIHGLGGQIGNFTHSLVDRLAGDFRVVALDRPGSGYSTRPPGAGANLRAQADLVAKFIAALGLERPLVVGHSLGGAISLTLAIDHPEAVGGLALVAPLTRPRESVPSSFRSLMIPTPALRWLVAWTLAVPATILQREKVLAEVFGPDAAPDDFPIKGGGALSLRPASFYNTSTDMMAVNEDLPWVVQQYGSIKVPVGVLFGSGDRVLDPQDNVAALRERIAGLEAEFIEGGHMLPVTASERTADWIRGQAGRIAKR